MTPSTFFALLGCIALVATLGEYAWSTRRGLGWHSASDTLANLNLAAGQLLCNALTAGLIALGYGLLEGVAPVQVDEILPGPVYWVGGYLLAELLQYWNHRLSHAWNALAWGHMTHHSSSYLNLSTGVRLNWFYRSYAWVLYAPMPLLGVDLLDFVLFQTAMNVYNLFCHTRLDISFGPLEHVLITPRSHRLHHSSDPRHYGNYGASLTLWDRVFGSYRVLEKGESDDSLRFGMAHNVDAASPLALNFHHLHDLWEEAHREPKRFVALLASQKAPEALAPRPQAGPARLHSAWWLASLGIIAVSVSVGRLQGAMAWQDFAGPALLGVGLSLGFGLALEGRSAARTAAGGAHA